MRLHTNVPVTGNWHFTNVSFLLSHTHHEDSFDDFAQQPLLPNKLSQLGPLGETLTRLAELMKRDEVAAGTAIVREGENGDRFYVLLSGIAAVSQNSLGGRRVLRAGEYFGEVALAMQVPRTATVTAMTPCVVASCDRATFDELLRPLFAEDPTSQ